ncbi:MAG TPA: cache domain-containing protein [Flavisolibacter sp.]|nr:cache domain-containing protein [Flavisolibacter sp.]
MKFLSLQRNYTPVLLTILFVVALGVIYFLIYIPQNEERLRQQRFHSLQNIDRNIHEKIDNSLALINNLLQSHTTADYIQHLRKTAASYFTLKFTGKQQGTLDLGAITDSNSIVSISDTARQIKLLSYKKTQTSSDTLSITYSFPQFFARLLPKNVFEEYVVFYNGKPVYTTARSGVAHLQDTLAQSNTDPSSGMKTCLLDGITYKLFLHPVSSVYGQDITIAGLVSDSRYQNERKKLPVEIVLMLITLLLALVIAFPIIKLYAMGNKDRLKLTDAVAVIVSSMLLMSLLFFAFFKYNRPLRPNANETDPKEHLANQISAAFRQEIDTAYHRLKAVDTIVRDHPQVLFSDRHRKTSLPPQLNPTASDDSLIKDSLGKQHIQRLLNDSTIRLFLWLDEKGYERVNWTADTINAPHGNYAERAYFRFIQDKKPYYLNDNNSQPFYLDQVISRVDGKFTTVLSLPSEAKPATVAAMAFRMQSIREPLLTPGFLFAIIDRQGRVLYHSDPDRNLNENLATEFSEQNRFRSALEAKVKDVFTTKYFGESYNILVQPIDHLPYSVVIFSDLGFRETRDMAIYSFTISMFLLLCLFFVVQLLTVFLVSAKRSFFKKQTYNTSWVAPKTSSHHQYNLATMANLLIILLAALFFRRSTFLTYVFILLMSVAFISLFLNLLFAKAYGKQMEKEGDVLEHQKNRGFKISAIRSLAALLVVIQMASFFVLDGASIVTLLIYEALAIGAGAFVYFLGEPLLNWLKKKSKVPVSNYWSYPQSFATMALTRLIITSGIPVVFFYLSAYNYEQNINVRYRQLQYADQLLNRTDSTGILQLAAGKPVTGIYNDSLWIKEISLVNDTAKRPSKEDNLTARILDGFRFNFTDIAVTSDRFSTPAASDTSFFYNPLLKIACKDTNATTTYKRIYLTPQYKHLSITSAGLNYRLPNLWHVDGYPKGLVFWLALMIALVVFYFIVQNILSKLFCLQLPDLTIYRDIDKEIIYNDETNSLVFIMGLPGAGKLTTLKEDIRAGKIASIDKNKNNIPLVLEEDDAEKGNVCVADLLTIPDNSEESELGEWNKAAEKYFNDKYRLIIVNHFEYNIQDSVTNRIKLNFLERLLLVNKAKIMILSTIHPVAFLDSITEQAPADKNTPGQDLERWHVLFGHFRMVILPLKSKHADNTQQITIPALLRETEDTHFLHKMRAGLFKVGHQKIEKENIPVKERFSRADELIFTLQLSAHYFYMYIWQSLTKEEKFLLYDLAEDNLVNSFDDYNLNLLIAKGVVKRRNGTLGLFNKGFRNFILTAIGNSEAMKIKNRIKDNGKWGSLRTPLVILMGAILLFLLASEEEAYSRLLTYVAALGAGIPAVLKFFSLFEKSPQKE